MKKEERAEREREREREKREKKQVQRRDWNTGGINTVRQRAEVHSSSSSDSSKGNTFRASASVCDYFANLTNPQRSEERCKTVNTTLENTPVHMYYTYTVRVVRTSSSSSIRRATLSRQSKKNGFIRFTTSCPWFGKRHEYFSEEKKKKEIPMIRMSRKDKMIRTYKSLSLSLSFSFSVPICPFIYLLLSPSLTRLVHR